MCFIKNFLSERAAKICIYALTLCTAFTFVLFLSGADNYRAASAATTGAGNVVDGASVPVSGVLPVPDKTAAEYKPSEDAAPNEVRAALAARQPYSIRNTSTLLYNREALSAEITRLAGLGFELAGYSLDYRGEFHSTAYCAEAYPHICGGNGITASGTVPTPGLTCAADWDMFSPGTWLYIEGVGVRRVEDSGSAIKDKRLDICVDTHINALRWPGFGTHSVWVLGGAPPSTKNF